MKCLNIVLNVKAQVGTFNQEKTLVGAFSVITNLRVDLRFKLYIQAAAAPDMSGQLITISCSEREVTR